MLATNLSSLQRRKVEDIQQSAQQPAWQPLQQPLQQPYRQPLQQPLQQPVYHPEQEDWERDSDRRVDLSELQAFGCLPPVVAGYLICALVLMEGSCIIIQLSNVIKSAANDAGHDWLMNLDEQNPFGGTTALMLLKVLGYGDLVVGVAGLIGLFMSQNSLVRSIGLRTYHSAVTRTCVGSLFLWRIIVAIVTAPTVGIMLSFELKNDGKDWVLFKTFVYLAINIFMLWAMMLVYRVAVQGGEAVQSAIDLSFVEERRRLIHGLYHSSQDEHDRAIMSGSEFFGLPLDVYVTAYLFVVFVLCIGWFVHGTLTQDTIGGWMFPLSPPALGMTHYFEQFVYVFTAVSCLIGLLGIAYYRNACDQELVAIYNLQGQPGTYSDELESAQKDKRRSLFFMLVSFVTGALRFGLFIPLTGMSLAATDVCGLYLRGLAGTAIKTTQSNAIVHCSVNDLGALAVVALLASIDAYFLWALFRLWRYNRSSSYKTEPSAAYGALKLEHVESVKDIVL